MGGATGDSEIKVVVFRVEEDVEDGRPEEHRRTTGTRLLQAVTALLVVAGLQVVPVVEEQPAEQPAERPAAPRARPVDGGGCPDRAGRRLWCSFIDDPGCCPVAAAAGVAGVAVPGSRAA